MALDWMTSPYTVGNFHSRYRENVVCAEVIYKLVLLSDPKNKLYREVIRRALLT